MIVGVGGANGSDGLGGNGLKAEFGERKTATKYAAAQRVIKSINMLNISHSSSFDFFFAAGASS